MALSQLKDISATNSPPCAKIIKDDFAPELELDFSDHEELVLPTAANSRLLPKKSITRLPPSPIPSKPAMP